ncbi:MAG: TolC family protein [Chitinophagaceae bacterium]|jgi:outer membrane protein|nr:TolC family protein [Chitinophagaceae bacterium]
MKRYIFLIALFFPFMGFAQNNKWDLLLCVNYAIEHNVSVRQADVQARMSALQVEASKAQQIPSLNFNTNPYYTFGRSVNQSTYQYVNTTAFQQTYSLQTSLTLFNWFNVANTIKSSQKSAEADALDVERAKNDIALNVANAYLQLLNSVEQVNISKTILSLDSAQLSLIRKQVDAGAKSDFDLATQEKQMASDSSNFFTNMQTMYSNKIQLMAFLNLSLETPFEVDVPDVDKIPLVPISELEPVSLYQIAMQNQFQQREDALRIVSEKYSIKARKGAFFPTISFGGAIGTNYSNQYTELVNTTPPTTASVSYLNQFKNNRNEYLGLTLNFNILNYKQVQTAYRREKLNLKNAELTQENNNLKLQQNIYTAYNSAVSGLNAYNSNTKAANAADYAYRLAKKRYDIGASATADYLQAVNNLYQARISQSISHYSYIFSMKVLEFYRDNHIKF